MIGISERQFERRSLEWAGVSPRALARISRFSARYSEASRGPCQLAPDRSRSWLLRSDAPSERLSRSGRRCSDSSDEGDRGRASDLVLLRMTEKPSLEWSHLYYFWIGQVPTISLMSASTKTRRSFVVAAGLLTGATAVPSHLIAQPRVNRSARIPQNLRRRLGESRPARCGHAAFRRRLSR